MFQRLELLIGEKRNVLKNIPILLVGIGGVGGYVLECLLRSGFERLTLVDPDCFDLSNINRQILATQDTIGKSKVEIAKERAFQINPNANITIIPKRLTKDLLLDLASHETYHYILDACDELTAKMELICFAVDHRIPILSCMGTANRFDPTKFSVVSLSKTYNDPLAKRLRMSLPKQYHKVSVVWSSELPRKSKDLGTICSLPMTAGALMASRVIQQCIKKSID